MVVYKAHHGRHFNFQHGRHNGMSRSITHAGLNFVLPHNSLYSESSLQGKKVGKRRDRDCCFILFLFFKMQLKRARIKKTRQIDKITKN